MRKVGLVKGKVRRAIAVASVFMLTCSVEAGGIEAGMMTSYAQQADDSGSADEFGGAEAAGAASEENEESGPEEDSVAGEESGSEKGSVEDEESGPEEGSGEGEEAGTEEGTGEEDETGSEEGSEEGEGSEPGEEAGEEEDLGEGEETGQEESSQEEEEAGTDEPTQEEEAGTDESPEKEEEAGMEEDSEAGGVSGDEETGTEEVSKEEEAGTEEDPGEAEETGTGENGSKEDETGSDGESGGKETDPVSTPSAETGIAQANQLTAVTPQAEAEEEWYLTEYFEDGGYYYKDEACEQKITEAFIEVPEEDSAIIYVDKKGERVTNSWIIGENRYVNGEGHVQMDKIRRAQESYGKFDSEGYWTAIENTLFYDEDWELWLYSGKDGKLAGPEGDKSKFYCLTDELKCYEYVRSTGKVGDEPQGLGWLDDGAKDFYIDAEGNLLTDAEQIEIDGYFYSFDSFTEYTDEYEGTIAVGNASLITNRPILDEEGEISRYVDENGEIVKNAFVDYEEETYYFDKDGVKLCRNWIEDDVGNWFYVNGEGHVVKDDTRRAGGSYGTFDEEGRWTPTKGFFEEELDDGTVVKLYADEEGDIAGPYDDEGMDAEPDKKMTFYRFVEEDGKTVCYLIRMQEEDELINEKQQGSIWIKDLYLGEDGYLITSQTSVKIGDTYYNFDAEGISSYAAGAIVEEDGKKYCVGEDGTFVKNQFADDEEGNTLYFGADGSQQFSQWVDDGGERFYVGADGYVV